MQQVMQANAARDQTGNVLHFNASPHSGVPSNFFQGGGKGPLDLMNMLGDQGWEVISIIPGIDATSAGTITSLICYLKRPEP